MAKEKLESEKEIRDFNRAQRLRPPRARDGGDENLR
jgi:hypothetical protein